MQVNMLEAKNCLSSLIVAAEQGEEVVIARNGVPVAKIVKYDAPRIKPPGAWQGKVPSSARFPFGKWRSSTASARCTCRPRKLPPTSKPRASNG